MVLVEQSVFCTARLWLSLRKKAQVIKGRETSPSRTVHVLVLCFPQEDTLKAGLGFNEIKLEWTENLVLEIKEEKVKLQQVVLLQSSDQSLRQARYLSPRWAGAGAWD